jgi:dephospho-CoA kinase
MEVPLLYEVGAESRFDRVVVITAPAKLREARSRVRDDRESRLLPEREKVKRADFVYVNTGTLDDLDAWVAELMAALTAEDAGSAQ